MKHQPVKQGQTTTPGTPCPTLCEKCEGSLTSPADHNSEDAGDGAYGLSSLSEKTRTSNHLQMQRQHVLLSYFKTLSVGPVWGSNPRPPARQSGALPTELTRRREERTKLLSVRSENVSTLKRLTVDTKLSLNI